MNKKLESVENLRLRAEKIQGELTPNQESKFRESTLLKLLQELEVYQIEIDLQKEELTIAKQEMEKIKKNYNNLLYLKTRLTNGKQSPE